MKKLIFILVAAVSFVFTSCKTEVDVTGVELNEETLTVYVGDSADLVASVLPDNADGIVTWSTSNAAVAIVNEGVIKGVAEGTANIVASVGDFTATCVVTVTKKPYNSSTDGITGEWQSSGANVAVLLSYYFSIDSIYAKFNENNTYVVESYANGAKTTYSGIYTQTKPTTGTIWKIKLEQSTPTAVTSEGIFEVTSSNSVYTMKYEVVQTSPSIGATAPTQEGGFGSSNGGALLTTNVQTFLRLTE